MVFVSYHNIDLDYAFRLSTRLIRYYRNMWLDRLAIEPLADWTAGIRQARERATAAIAIISDSYLDSAYCRAEFEYFQARGIPVTAVIARDFSTDMIADFAFNDWVDFRRWFDDPSDRSVENLLSQIPADETATGAGERLDALRSFIQATEMALAKMPSAWAALRNGDAPGAEEMRPRMLRSGLITDGDFMLLKAGASLAVEDLLQWSADEPQFIIKGEAGSGKTFFARLLALVQAHRALWDTEAALPFWIDLAEWDGQYDSFEAFMEAQWPLLSYWRHWLESNPAFIVFDHWSDLCATNPTFAGQARQWIDGSPKHRIVLLSTRASASDPDLPALRINRPTIAFAQKLAGGCLTLDQQSGFRQLLREKAALVEASQLAQIAIGIELFASDRAQAFNHWHSDPMPPLLSNRLQQLPAAAYGLDAAQILAALRGLAWSMMLQDNHRFVARAAAEYQASDSRVIDAALDLGLLSACGDRLRFESIAMQRFLAVENLKQDGLFKYLTRPEFAAGSGRVEQKWDGLVLIAVDSLPQDSRLRIIDQIADIDPFLALMCLRRNMPLYKENAEGLIAKLLRLCAQNPNAQDALRATLAGLPDPDLTTVMMLAQMSRFSNPQQLWLWRELSALPLELPVDFLNIVSEHDRRSAIPVSEQVADYNLSLAVAWLVKLAQGADKNLRQNAIWMLGEIKYLPTAILLLDYLEDPDRSDQSEVLLALMKFAYSEILVRVLQWSQDNPAQRKSVVAALAARGRLVTSRLLSFADARKLTLNPEFYEIAANTNETDIAIGLAGVIGQRTTLPESLELAIMRQKNASEMERRIAGAIKHLPNREGLQQLLDNIAQVLEDPPESTVVAGSNIEALLYGKPLFDEFSAQAEGLPRPAIPDDLARQIHDADWQERQRALSSLADYSADLALPILLEMTDDEDKRVRLAAYEGLSRFDEDAAARSALVAALEDDDSDIVTAAIELLAAAKSAAAAPELRRLLDDSRPADGSEATIGQLARDALNAIEEAQGGSAESATGGPAPASYGDEEKIRRTLQVLRDDDWGRAQKAARFLRKFAKHLRCSGSPKILPLLLDALDDSNWSVRWASAEALAMLQNRAAIPRLAQCLSDAHWIVQVAAIRALAELNAREEAARIAPLLRSPHKALREAAAEALGQLGDTRVIPALGDTLKNDADEFLRLAALKSIYQINAAAARPWLELALSDGYLPLRLFAMRRLSPEMNESDLPILQELLIEDETPSWESVSLRDLAIETLRRIDSAESRALLQYGAALEGRNGA